MSQETGEASIDLVRWTFILDSPHRAEVEAHLVDLGLDVSVHGGNTFTVTWEEPDREVETVIEELWELNGAPFEVTQEEFHRIGHHLVHHVDHAPSSEAA